MKILIDIGHPAHVHLFRHLVKEVGNRGHEVTVTVRDIPAAKQLLSLYNIEFQDIGGKRDSIFAKMVSQIVYDFRTWRIIRKKKIELGIGSSIVLPHMSVFTRMKSVVLDDDDDIVEPLFAKFAHPFATLLLSPEALSGKRRRKDTVYYPGYHELAYLYPGRFTPDRSVLEYAGLKETDTFFVMRFNAFKAHHDLGVRGISLDQKLRLIEKLKPLGPVFITTERDIEPELREYKLPVPPDKIHSLLYYATLFIGDSQTMTSEAAVLGTPALRMNSFAGKISYLEEEEKRYHLTYSFGPDDFNALTAQIDELLAMEELKEVWKRRRDIMLEERKDPNIFLLWIIENYPESIKILKKDPAYFIKSQNGQNG